MVSEIPSNKSINKRRACYCWYE